MASDEQQLHIGGVPLKFPFKPYPTQLSMMAKIIQALNKKENALLESPTGSGKSLSLLCASLAWQRSMYEKMHVENNPAGKTDPCQCACHVDSNASCCAAQVLKDSSTTELNTSIGNNSKGSDGLKCMDGSKYIGSSKSLDSSKCSESSKSLDSLKSIDGSKCLEGSKCLDGSKCSRDPLTCKVVSTDSSAAPVKGAVSTSSENTIAGVPLAIDQLEDKGDHQTTSKDGLTDDDKDFKPATKRYRQVSPERTAKQQKSGKRKGIAYMDSPSLPPCDTQLPPSDDGMPTWKMKLNNGTQANRGPQASSSHSSLKPGECYNKSSPVLCQSCACGSDTKSKGLPPQTCKPVDRKHSLVPKIYVCTRTHKQIAQLVRELSRTSYSNTLMTILSSRDHTCINPEVADSTNRSEECTQLLRNPHGPMCLWFNNVQTRMGTHAQLISHGLCTAWDIEDLVALGKKTKACPYFASRNLLLTADVVFCPYNYVIDPNIRAQMNLEVKGHVIILDEAHNMEDCAREAASITLTSTQLADVANEIQQLMVLPSTDETKESYGRMMALCHNMAHWMEETASSLPQRGFEETCGLWSGAELFAILRGLGVMDTTLPLLQEAYEILYQLAEQQTSLKFTDQMSTVSLSVLRGILMVYNFMFKEGQKYFNDYRVCLMRTTAFKKITDQSGGWRGKKRRTTHTEKVWVVNLHFWCMNPAVAFTELLGAHSIILTSGTLSPIHSFSSELGVDFPIQLEANHVVPEAQTWIYSIPSGPNGHSLLANFQNSETYEFQDEVGAVIEHVCMNVPFGILCFLPSYKMLEKLVARWKQTDQWYKISQRKVIVSEPRSGEREDFNTTMEDFYRVIETSHAHQPGGESEGICDGALFLAVCRGKVSEGLDFADNNARAVITVGIPFPNFKDKQVELKREYNTSHSQSRGLLSGSEWYEIQAYRAINQALGRCIRHVKDWGALLLVDDRFSKGQNYTKGLSRWVRTRLGHHSDFGASMASLKHFVEERIAHDSPHSDTIPFPPQTVPCGPLDCPSSPLPSFVAQPSALSITYMSPPSALHLVCQSSLNALVPPSVSLLDITSDQHMTSPRREWTTTGLNQDNHPSATLSQHGLVNIPSPPNQIVVPTTTNQRPLVDIPSTSNQIVIADAPTPTHPRALIVSPTQQRACVDVLLPNNQKDLTDTAFLTAQSCMNNADSKRHGLEGLLPQAMQQRVPSLSLSSPILLDSAPSVCSSPIPIPLKTLHPAPTVHQRYAQLVASSVKCPSEALDSSDDSDVTPPISPQQRGSSDAKAVPGKQQLFVVDRTKTPTSGHLKRNVRIARAKSCVERGVNNIGCEKQSTPLLHVHIRCLCCESLCQGKVLVETIDLRSYLVKCGVTYVGSSNLLSHFGNVASADVATVHVADYSQMTCSFKKAPQLNAIWDSVLHLCYGLLECPRCKRDVGIGMHLARDCDTLAGKAFMDCRSVELISQSEKDHEMSD